MKTHLNLATEDLGSSVEFYSILLNVKPTKLRPDYALFITEQPPLELALDAVRHTPRSSLEHYGIYVETVDELEQAIQRFEKAGLASSIERERTCCYASQSKVWAVDPTGRRWEIYTVHAETTERVATDTSCCAGAAQAQPACCDA